jgi:hypothetical protein
MVINLRSGYAPPALFSLTFILLVVICVGIYPSRDAVPSDTGCRYRVITLTGAPYEAIDDEGELLGYFDRQPDGKVWLRGVDTSVADASKCLKQKGFADDTLAFISPR